MVKQCQTSTTFSYTASVSAAHSAKLGLFCVRGAGIEDPLDELGEANLSVLIQIHTLVVFHHKKNSAPSEKS